VLRSDTPEERTNAYLLAKSISGRAISIATPMADITPAEQIVVDAELGEFGIYLWKAETLRAN
jgi:hypothetical protein